jgi:biopolymer transport protein ExbD
MRRLTGTLGGSRQAELEEVELNMTPLIDMIFILLIFFLVTAGFIRESGIEVNRPEAVTSEKTDAVGMVVGITGDGRAFIDNNEVETVQIRGLVEIFLGENAGGAVIIDADSACPSGRLVEVLDQCRLAGAVNIAVTADRPGE